MIFMNEVEPPLESRPRTIAEDPAEDWRSMDWQYAEKQVRRIQAKISRAVSEGRTNDAMRFTHLLTVSFLSKALAVRRVCDDPMSGTPGVDKVLWSTDADRMMAARDLDLKGFRPRQLRHFRVRDTGDGRHYMDLPVMRDRAFLELIAMAFEPVHDTLVGGIRSSSADAVSLLRTDIAGKEGAGWVLTANIAVADADALKVWMSGNVLIDRRVVRRIVDAGFLFRGELVHGDRLSPMVEDVVLRGLEDVGSIRSVRSGNHVDVVARSREDAERVAEMLAHFLEERGLGLVEMKLNRVGDRFELPGFHIESSS